MSVTIQSGKIASLQIQTLARKELTGRRKKIPHYEVLEDSQVSALPLVPVSLSHLFWSVLAVHISHSFQGNSPVQADH